MKHSSVTAAEIRKDLRLSDQEFSRRYPGLEKSKIENLTNAELERIAGGFIRKGSNPFRP